MGDGWGALLVAVVGVAGTLTGTLLSQSRADRTKRLELAAAAEQRREERDHADALLQAERAEARAQQLLALRRACYIAVNTAARQYMTAQVNVLHALRDGTGDLDAELQQLEERRTAHREHYAEAQMIMPVKVLAVAGIVSRHLNTRYGTLKRIAGTTPCDSAQLRAFDEGFDEAWGHLSHLRGEMREDLAVDAASTGFDDD
ncbi:hypothetical protein [Streptomyces sp. NPDC048639]|uniref:hypothetical protein n=1 Tax=Streptomyces sp. NPDC048639 TaxID=3365581 RepID=UPI00371E944C